MNKSTAKALEASIKHWEENAKAETIDAVSTSADDCALCEKFNALDNQTSCVGCPVFAATGKPFCEGTPFETASLHRRYWYFASSQNYRARAAAFRKAARAELAFLESLRDPAA